MKFSLNSKERKKINKLLTTKEINMTVAEMLMSFFDYDLSDEKPQNADEIISLFMEAMELDDKNQQNKEIVEEYIKKNLRKLDDCIFKENKYFQTVKPKLVKVGDYELTFDHYYPYQMFSYDDLLISEDFKEISRIGYFDHKVDFLALSYKGNIWMNISPNEINTMAPSIKEAKGNVLVLGLGLGYYAFMVSEKDDVEKVTIIENDENIINIFNNYLFKFFPHKEKIQIIKDDAYNFTNENAHKFNYIFVDLWHNPEDGLPIYLKFKGIEKEGIQYFYWLENGLKAMYNRCLLTVVEEQFANAPGSAYEKSENDIDQIINNLYHKLKNREVISYSSIISLLER